MSGFVDSHFITSVLDELATKYAERAIVLYGSNARRDSNASSDIDILVAGGSSFSQHGHDRVRISFYPIQTLHRLAIEGSLFILHLKTEAVVFRDPLFEFESTLGRYIAPKSYEPLRAELRLFANVLDVGSGEYQRFPAWLNRVGLFILRTALFADFAERGMPTFSVQKIAKDLGRPELVQVYERKYQANVSYGEFLQLKRLVEWALQTQVNNGRTVTSFLCDASQNSTVVRAFAIKLRQLTESPDLDIIKADYVISLI